MLKTILAKVSSVALAKFAKPLASKLNSKLGLFSVLIISGFVAIATSLPNVQLCVEHMGPKLDLGMCLETLLNVI